jgi:hypothetical protein
MSSRRLTKLIVPWTEAHQALRDRIELGEALLSGEAGRVGTDPYGREEVEGDEELTGARERAMRWDSYNYELLRRIFDSDEFAEQYESYLFGNLVDPGFRADDPGGGQTASQQSDEAHAT